MGDQKKPVRNIDSIKLTPPSWLRIEAKKIFRRLSKELHENGLTITTDIDALALLSDQLHTYQEASKSVSEKGILVKGKDDQIVRNPGLIVQSTIMGSIQKLLIQFGMSPSSRAQFKVVDGKENEDLVEQFLGGVMEFK
jgi:P27 family predicted phage terminase small subunit